MSPALSDAPSPSSGTAQRSVGPWLQEEQRVQTDIAASTVCRSVRSDGSWRSPHRSRKNPWTDLPRCSVAMAGSDSNCVALWRRNCLVTTRGKPGKGVKGRGETDLGSKRREEQGRHSRAQTERAWDPIDPCSSQSNKTNLPSSYSASSEGPPSPALFPQLINLGFGEGQTPCLSLWWPETTAGPNLGPLRPRSLSCLPTGKSSNTKEAIDLVKSCA